LPTHRVLWYFAGQSKSLFKIPIRDKKMAANFHDILEAFEFVNFGSMYEHQAFLDKETGKVYYHSEFGDDEEELPEDIDDEKYIEIPCQNELNLGEKLVLDFAHQYLPDEVAMIHAIFNRKGAYSKYKDLLEQREMLEQWYEFESKKQEKALREWCESSSIEIND
jgi:hypothetical protein